MPLHALFVELVGRPCVTGIALGAHDGVFNVLQMTTRTSADRAKIAVRLLYHQKKLILRDAATRLGVSTTSMWHYVQGERPLTLDALDAISGACGVPLVELLADPDAVIKQLDAEEAALLRAVRDWPKDVLRHLLRFVWHFDQPAPTAKLSRDMHTIFRELTEAQRSWIYGLSVGLREGVLPPDIQEGLAATVQGEAAALRAAKRKKDRRNHRA